MVAHNRKTNEIFVAELEEKNIPFVPLEKYVDSHTKIAFRCKECNNTVYASPTNVLSGKGCVYCRSEKSKKRYMNSHEKFVSDAAVKNPNVTILGRYDGYKNSVKVLCNKHNRIYFPKAAVVLRGCGCEECLKENISIKNRSTVDYFLEKSKKNSPHLEVVEPNKYVNARTMMKVRCKIHGNTFSAVAEHIADGMTNCPICAMSSGEHCVALFLDGNGYEYKTQYIPEDGELGRMRFDFYIPKINTIVEYDGAQHFKPVGHWGGEEALARQKKSDQIKNDYCAKKGINLIRIPYTEKDVAKYLKASGL